MGGGRVRAAPAAAPEGLPPGLPNVLRVPLIIAGSRVVGPPAAPCTSVRRTPLQQKAAPPAARLLDTPTRPPGPRRASGGAGRPRGPAVDRGTEPCDATRATLSRNVSSSRPERRRPGPRAAPGEGAAGAAPGDAAAKGAPRGSAWATLSLILSGLWDLQEWLQDLSASSDVTAVAVIITLLAQGI